MKKMVSFADTVLGFVLFFYCALGSSSVGYIFFRAGWPKVRVLEASYKKGWSIIFGVAFFAASAMLALVTSLILPGISFATFFFLFIALLFLCAMIALTVERKLLRQQRVTVSVPNAYLKTKVVAQKARTRLETDPALVIEDQSTQKNFLQNIRKTQPQKNGGEEKPVGQKDFAFDNYRNENPETAVPVRKTDGAATQTTRGLAERVPPKKIVLQKQQGFEGIKTDELFGAQNKKKLSSKYYEEFEAAQDESGLGKGEMSDVLEIESIDRDLEQMRREKNIKSTDKAGLLKLSPKKKVNEVPAHKETGG